MNTFGLSVLLAVGWNGFLAVTVPTAESPPVQPREARLIFADGKHSAFTALARFCGQFWLASRSAKDHNSADGDIVVLRSPDTKTWTEAFRLNVLPDDRDPQFLVTEKQLFWKKVSTIRAGNWESETTRHFDSKDRATAFLRQKSGSPPCQILEADSPYTEWKSRSPGVPHLSGHSVPAYRGVTYLLSRTMAPKSRQAGQMIHTYAAGKLHLYCALPAECVCAYAETVEFGDAMLVSYYSSHEGTTNIYLAVMPLKS